MKVDGGFFWRRWILFASVKAVLTQNYFKDYLRLFEATRYKETQETNTMVLVYQLMGSCYIFAVFAIRRKVVAIYKNRPI